MRAYEQRLDEAREELARAADGETAARLSARIEVLERRIEEAYAISAGLGPVPGLRVKFSPLKHPRGRAGKFRATGEYHGPNPQMASIGQETVAFRSNVSSVPGGRSGSGRTDPYTGGNPHMASIGQAPGSDAPKLVRKIRDVFGYDERRKRDVVDTHQLKIARSTLKMNPAMGGVMGGPSVPKALETVRQMTGRLPNYGDVHKANRPHLDRAHKEEQSLHAATAAETSRSRAAELRAQGNEEHAKDYDEMAARFDARHAEYSQKRKEIPGPSGVGMNVSDEQFTRGLDNFLSPEAMRARSIEKQIAKHATKIHRMEDMIALDQYATPERTKEVRAEIAQRKSAIVELKSKRGT